MDTVIRYELPILDIVQEAPGTRSYYLEIPDALGWDPGAHAHIALIGRVPPENEPKGHVRHLSLCSLSGEGRAAFTTRVPGSGSFFKRQLETLRPGDALALFKIGSRMSLRRSDRPVVLVSMGVAVATMRPLVLSYLADRTGVPSLLCANVDRSGSFVFRGELDQKQDDVYRNEWFEGRAGLFSWLNGMRASSAAAERPWFHVAGSDDFLKDVVRILLSRGVASDDIILDKKPEALHDFFPA